MGKPGFSDDKEQSVADQDSRLPWARPGWFEQAIAWIHAELERQNIRVSGTIDQPHVRPWSTVLRVPTSEGDVYFKATMPVLAHEPALTRALSRWRPDVMLQLLATDLGRGWMLMADGGTRLREVIRADRDLRHWEALLPIYAELQIELSGRLHELLALGAPDRRLAALPAQYERLLADTTAMHIDLPRGLTSAEYGRLNELAPRFAALCEKLTGYRIPETLHHGDFHDGNIFVRDGRYRFFDWGDSCVAHPFFSLRTTFVSVEYSLGLDQGAAEFVRLRDAYLEPWTRYESREDLLAAFKLAHKVGMVNSALGWYRVVSSLEELLKEEYAEPVPALLQEFLGAETVSSA